MAARSSTETGGPGPAGPGSAAWRDGVVAAALFFGSLGYFGLTLSRVLELQDEGYFHVLASLVADGAVPHRDFSDLYGPGPYWLNGALHASFAREVLPVRWVIAGFKAAAWDHMLKMMLDIVLARAGIIEELLWKVNIVVSTCDAWCKWRSGGIKGNMGQALGQRKPVLYIMDEMEGYSVDQVLAATAADETSPTSTLVMIGDVHQRLSFKNPKYPRVPWISNDPGEGVAREMR